MKERQKCLILQCKSSRSQRKEDDGSARASVFAYDYAYYFILKAQSRVSEAGRSIQGHVRALTRPLPCPVTVQFSRKADYQERRSYFSIFVSLLRVTHAGQPSNPSTLLQSQTKSGPRARSHTVREGSPQCTGLCTVCLSSVEHIISVPGLYSRVYVHNRMHGRLTCKCYGSTWMQHEGSQIKGQVNGALAEITWLLTSNNNQEESQCCAFWGGLEGGGVCWGGWAANECVWWCDIWEHSNRVYLTDPHRVLPADWTSNTVPWWWVNSDNGPSHPSLALRANIPLLLTAYTFMSHNFLDVHTSVIAFL